MALLFFFSVLLVARKASCQLHTLPRAGEFLHYEDELHGPYELKAPSMVHYEKWALPGVGQLRELEVGIILPQEFNISKPYPVMLCFGGGPQQRFNWEDWQARFFDVSRARGFAKTWIFLAPIAPLGQNFMSSLVPDVERLMAVVKDKYVVQGGLVHLAGQSNGGNSAFKIAMRTPELFASLTVHTGVASTRSLEMLSRLRNLHIRMYVGDKDCFDFHHGMQRTATALLAAGHPPERLHFTMFPNVGHFGILDVLVEASYLEEFWQHMDNLLGAACNVGLLPQ